MKFTVVDHDALAINFHMAVSRFSGMKLVHSSLIPAPSIHTANVSSTSKRKRDALISIITWIQLISTEPQSLRLVVSAGTETLFKEHSLLQAHEFFQL